MQKPMNFTYERGKNFSCKEKTMYFVGMKKGCYYQKQSIQNKTHFVKLMVFYILNHSLANFYTADLAG